MMKRVMELFGFMLFTLIAPFSLDGSEYLDTGGIGNGYAGGEVGVEKIDEDYFLAINPVLEFPIRRWLFGLQLPLRLLLYDAEPGGESFVRKEDWDEVSDYGKIIRHLRYGTRWDPFFLDYGTLYSSDLGNATMVSRYCNNLFTDTYQAGVNISVDTRYGGGEFLMGNLFDPLFSGIRGFVKPLSLFSGEKERPEQRGSFYTGSSLAWDREAPFHPETGEMDGVESEFLVMAGLDAGYRFQPLNWIRMTPYIDFNQIIHYGGGVHIGIREEIVSSLLNSLFDLRLEYRFMAGNYIPAYFDTLYEVERYSYYGHPLKDGEGYGTKLDFLKEGERGYGNSGFSGSLSAAFGGYIQVKGALEDMEGKGNSKLYLGASLPQVLNLAMDIFYYRSGFDTFKEAFDLDGAAFIAIISYRIMNSLYLYVRFYRLFEEVEGGGYENVDTISAGAGTRFYF